MLSVHGCARKTGRTPVSPRQAFSLRLPLLATGGVNYAVPEHRIVSDVFTCLRYHTTLNTAGRCLDGNDQRGLKPAAHMRQLFRDLPEALANSVRVEERLEFTLENLGYEFPSFPTPPGQSMDDYLREQVNAPCRVASKTPSLRSCARSSIANSH